MRRRGQGNWGNRGQGNWGNRGQGNWGNKGQGNWGNKGQGNWGMKRHAHTHSHSNENRGHLVSNWKRDSSCSSSEENVRATYDPAMGDRGYLGRFHASNFNF